VGLPMGAKLPVSVSSAFHRCPPADALLIL
jgi:hypothetical protein